MRKRRDRHYYGKNIPSLKRGGTGTLSHPGETAATAEVSLTLLTIGPERQIEKIEPGRVATGGGGVPFPVWEKKPAGHTEKKKNRLDRRKDDRPDRRARAPANTTKKTRGGGGGGGGGGGVLD